MNRILAGALGVCLGANALGEVLPKSSVELFQLNHIWSARLSFTAKQWAELQPDQPQQGFPFGPPGGGRGGFGPGTFLAGPMLAILDADKDGGVTRMEFDQGWAVLFQKWDSKKQGFLTDPEIRAGINKDLAIQFGPPGGGGPGGPGGGPGAPGSRGPGGGPGFGLQGPAGGRNGLSALRGIEFDYVHADLQFASFHLTNVAVRYKGNGTFMDAGQTAKKSFKVDLNEFVKGQKLGGVSKLNFHNNITDAALMNEPLAYALYREAGVPAPRSSYARLNVDAPGTHTNRYLGLYSLVENPDNNWAEEHFGSKKGLILKPVTRELFKFQGEDWSQYQQAYDPKTDPTEPQMRRFFALARLVTEADDEEFARRLPEFVDVDEFSRFMAVTIWLSSTDSILMMGQNFVVYLHPKSDKFLFVPWDLDRAFGNFFTPSPTEMSIQEAWAADNRFLQRVMKVATVKEAYLARMTEFQKTIFRPERLSTQVDELAKILRPAVEEELDSEKLDRFDRVVAGEAPAQRGFGPPSGQTIKTFVKARYESVADQLAGKSMGQALGSGFGGPGGRGPRGPGGPGGMTMPGPGEFWTSVVIKESDRDTDGKVSAVEFQGLAETWFKAWDKEAKGNLKQEDMAAGLNKLMPEFRPPGR